MTINKFMWCIIIVWWWNCNKFGILLRSFCFLCHSFFQVNILVNLKSKLQWLLVRQTKLFHGTKFRKHISILRQTILAYLSHLTSQHDYAENERISKVWAYHLRSQTVFQESSTATITLQFATVIAEAQVQNKLLLLLALLQMAIWSQSTNPLPCINQLRVLGNHDATSMKTKISI